MFGEHIRSLRKAHALSQAAFGSRLGVAKQTVSNWENGNAMPSVDLLVKIASIYSVSTDYLLGLDEVPALRIEGLSERELDFLRRMIGYLPKSK